MIIYLADHTEVDTDRDLCAEERHILQKLLGYVQFADSLGQFRTKKKAAFLSGWNNSGPVQESPLMARIALQLEHDLLARLQ
ncbi:MAG: hypothetical protein ACK5PS_10320 [Desulfopila sp.]